MGSIVRVADFLKKNAKNQAHEMVDDIIHQIGYEVPEVEINQAKGMYVEFLGFLGDSIHCNEGSIPEVLLLWSKGNGERTASKHQQLSDILTRYPDTRIIFTDYMLEIALNYGLTAEEEGYLLKRVNHMLDVSKNETMFAFERKSKEIVKSTRKEIIELSTPVVPIQNGIAILPLIGAIDRERSEHLLN